MVKLGFIVEGDSEKRILESQLFRELLNNLELPFIEAVENVRGRTNLKPERIINYVKILEQKGASHIVILTDQEDAPCITSVKKELDFHEDYLVVIAVKTIEAWYLADSSAITVFMEHRFDCDLPEVIQIPFNHIKEEKIRLTGRGVNSKRLLCSRMLHSGFSIENAAKHPNCPSAKYFIQKLKELADSQIEN